MNSRPISSYDDLCKEKARLTELLKGQKAQIQRDIEELKDEFTPMLSLSENVAKLLSREDGKDPIVAAGTNIGIDLLIGKMFSKSNFLVRFLLPAILKNVSSHLLPDAIGPFKKQPIQKTVVERTVIREQKPARADKPVLTE